MLILLLILYVINKRTLYKTIQRLLTQNRCFCLHFYGTVKTWYQL